MRDYGKVYTAFWTSEDVRSMSEDARTLAFYLLTCPHGNMLGCFRLTDAYAADDLKWTPERVSKGFIELAEKGYAYRCDRTFWVFIHLHLKWNQFDNPNVGKAAGKMFDSITPPHAVKVMLAKALREFSETFPVQKLDEFETLSIPVSNPLTLSSKTVAVAAVAAVPEAVAAAVAIAGGAAASDDTPPKKDKPERTEGKSSAVWSQYCHAYQNRYGAEPVRNSKVNSQLCQVVDRIGALEAPFVAAFYVGHNGAFYSQKMHSVDMLLADCEKLRTEWVTRTQMTQTKAMQADKTQTNYESFAPLIAEAEARERANG